MSQNREKSCFIIILTIFILTCIITIFTIMVAIETSEISKNNMEFSMKAIVVRDMKNKILVLELDNDGCLSYVKVPEGENIEFKQGQEVLIYYNGFIETMNPSVINDVGKIEVIKEKSDFEIPENIIAQAYELEF